MHVTNACVILFLASTKTGNTGILAERNVEILVKCTCRTKCRDIG